MLPALLVVLLLGFPVAFSMMGVAFFFGYLEFGDSVVFQFVGKIDDVSSNFVLAAVPLFVFMGTVLERSGIAEKLFEAIHLWTKPLPGGLALCSIMMCLVFAASSGVIGATEVVVGLLAIPVMLKHHYNKALISGTICAGGSLGTIIPPSVVVVVLGPTADVSVADLFVAMIFPGLILALCYMLYIVVRCALDPTAGPKEKRGESSESIAERLIITAKALLPPVLMITAVLGSIMAGLAAPTEAAGLGALGSLLLTFCYRSFSWSMLNESIIKTVKVTTMIMSILLAGNMFTGVFIASGGVMATEEAVHSFSLGPWQLLTLVLALSFVLGLFLDWISIILIVIPIFTPIISNAGFNPIWFCILFLLIIQTSYLSPPMAPAIFYLRGISPPEIALRDMFRGVIPFIVLQILVLFLVMIYPDLALWLPEQVLGFK